MTVYVALVRAVNVGGTGTLPMTRLAELCTSLGLRHVRTYIQSGNVVFSSPWSADAARTALEMALTDELGTPAQVIIRTAAELERSVSSNPFPDAEGAKVGVALAHEPVPAAVVGGIPTPGGEQVVAGERELYVYYPDGMGRSKLTLPKSLGPVTVRNMNTMTKLVSLTRDIPAG
ncbi:DUF1697 domain-containing protein [Marisediminicola antarctica]|uniref:DUF1697 domain-containing protein n=1 Tax=Marisediminicola antarctica TaxID=674079 RepID=A0A7L5AMQ9_9MICO|nr:DUF1697 domain-containing protein [Marisediminicola antarctica]QHO70624.1 hypothetical protein BHD05_14165 [Marisediminicola antarctica]